MQPKTLIKLKFLAGAMVILVIALGINAVLSSNSLKHLYVETIASRYSVIGSDLRRNLEKALFFGKSLRQFVGIDKILEDTKRNIIQRVIGKDTSASGTDISVSVVLPEGIILYSTDEKLVGTTLPEKIRMDYGVTRDETPVSQEFHYVNYHDTYFVTLPVRDSEKNWVATIIITFEQKQISVFLNTVLENNVKVISLILFANIILLLPILKLIISDSVDIQTFPKIKFAVVMFLVVFVSQIVFSALSASSFRKYYLNMKMAKAEMLTVLLKEDIEDLLYKGVPIIELTNIDVLMGEIIAAFPELQSMMILDKGRIPLYIATRKSMIDVQQSTDDQLKRVYRRMPVFDREYNLCLELLKDGKFEGYICVNLSQDGAVSTVFSEGGLFTKLLKIVLGLTFVLCIFFPLFSTLIFHKLRLVASVFVVLILALGFNALLSLHSLEKSYVGSIASQYTILGEDLRRNLEKAIFFGKPIKKFVGMNKLLEEAKGNVTKVHYNGLTPGTEVKTLSASEISVSIALPDGSILYSTEERLVGTMLPEQVRNTYTELEKNKTALQKTRYVKYDNTYSIPLLIRNSENTWIASAIMTFHGHQIKTFLDTIRNKHIKMGAIILGISIFLLVILLDLVTYHGEHFHPSPKLRIALVMLLVIGAAQIVFSGLNTYAFRTYYLRINRQKADMLTALLKEDVEFLLNKGVPLDKLSRMDVVMGEIIEICPELNGIMLLNKDEDPLYMATKESVSDFRNATDEQRQAASRLLSASTPQYTVRSEILNDDTIEGYMFTTLSKDVISKGLCDIALDSATVLAISLLFFGELLFLIFVYLQQELTSPEEWAARHHYEAIRPAAFLFLFGCTISISFLPLYMATLYKPIFNLSKDVVMGLPISIKMFFTGLSIVIAGAWLDRRGWHEPFLSGLALTGLGLTYSWLAPDALHFVISRGILGLGYGFSLMAAQGFVITRTDKNNRTQGLTHLFAGVFAGSICGGSAGGMLAEQIGYRPVFFLGAVVVFSVIAYTTLFMRNTIQKKALRIVEHPKQSVSRKQILDFFLNRSVLSLIVFASLPAALTIVGFLDYFSPIYLNRIGVSASNIGRIFMIHGVCLIYIAPFISRYIDRSSSKKTYVFISCFLGGLAFISFYFLGGILASAVAVLLLGLSDSFSDSRSSYILKLKVTQELGAGKAMGIFSSVARIGQVLGPITFAWLLVSTGDHTRILYVGLAYLLTTGLFFLFTPNDKMFDHGRQ